MLARCRCAGQRVLRAGVGHQLELHAAILQDVLAIGTAHVAAGDRLAYTGSATEARGAVESGEAQAAILVRPTGLDQLQAVAGAGDVMPQKSTYFYPKLLTGMAFYSLED